MAIDFSMKRWEQVKETHRLWWRGELDRPLLYATVFNGDRGRDEPDLPWFGEACWDFSIPPKDVIDRLDYDLSGTIYHLDGVGQLPHVDSLLAIDELDGIQWVPGEGQPHGERWADLYCRILAAGKKVELYGTTDLVDIIERRGGTASGCVVWQGGDKDDLPAVTEFLARYGLPPM